MYRRFYITLIFILLLSACNYPQSDSPELCGRKRLVRDMLSESSMPEWAERVAELTGARPVILDGQPQTITTRFSYAMFSKQPNARAFDYVLALLSNWVEPQQLEVLPYTYRDAEQAYTWKNIVVTFPGIAKPEETILLTAHLDSTLTHDASPMALAPGADDNASGAASILEAVRLLRGYQFARTIKVVFFTGEEQFEAGSRQFVASYPLNNVLGVINLDMVGYKSGSDRIIQLHAGNIPESQQISNCFIQTSLTYNLNIVPQVFTSTSSDRSDHASFWQKNIPAVWVFDGMDQNQNLFNPNYHRPQDNYSTLNIDFGFSTYKNALATTASLAMPLHKCFNQNLNVQVKKSPGEVILHWNALPGAVSYRVLRSETDCNNGWSVAANTGSTDWQDPDINSGKTYHYRVEAVTDSTGGYCTSIQTTCLAVTP